LTEIRLMLCSKAHCWGTLQDTQTDNT